MQFILVDIADRSNFYPFSLTRSVGDLRVGIFTFKERWEAYLGETVGVYTVKYLQTLYHESNFLKSNESLYFINCTCLPTIELIEQIKILQTGEKLINKDGKWIASKSNERHIQKILLPDLPPKIFNEVSFVTDALQLLSHHKTLIQHDFNWIISNRSSQPIDSTNRVLNESQIFIEEGASVLCSNLNASYGPIYIGKDAIVMEGTSIKGPFVLGSKGTIKMNSSIYGSTTIGPYCLAGGEIKNSILMGFTNKGHEGYLGDSIIGYWCNLGAGTCNSNIKNTASNVELWNEARQMWETVGQKMGMVVGDYSRFAILSRINTGSYIGVSANVFGQGLLPKMLPNFTWGIVAGYHFEKAIDDIHNWKKMKGFGITDAEKLVLQHLYDGH